MRNHFVKKFIVMMLTTALFFGEAGTWTASASEISEDVAESAETELSDDENADAEDGGENIEESDAGITDDTGDGENQVQTEMVELDIDEEETDPEVYTELMDYVDATSALLAEYPCEYDGTLDIDIDSGEITNQNGESVNAMDDALEAAVDSDDTDAAAETLEENGYVVLGVNDDMVSVEDPYQTMRLIVSAEEGLSSAYGAEVVISYEDEYILQYGSTEDTINAYTALAADAEVDELYVDAVISVYENETADETVSSFALSDEDGADVHLSWGVETMGLDVMQEKLEAADTEESTEDDLTEVVVAVVDSGVNYENIYLDGRVLSEDGYDCYNEDDDAMDDYGHGTHVAGIVVDGTSDNVMILPVKVMDSSGNGTVLTVRNGIRYALDYGTDVINLSLGLDDSTGTASFFEDLFQETLDNGCVIVCAAGNSSMDVAYCYPANSERTIAVSALNTSMSRASYSNYGDAVDFSAPGSSIKSAYYTSSTETNTMSGTSMATPHVTAAVALLKTWDYTLSNDEIEKLLEEYSVDLGDEGKDASYGYGYIYLGDFDVNQEDALKSGNDSEAADLTDAEVSLYAYTYTYNGYAKKPPVTVSYNGTILTKNTDYTVIYSDNVNAGTALVTVTGKGNYTGSAEQEFVIEKASSKLAVDTEEYSLVSGDSEAIAVSCKGDGDLTYTSSDDTVAAVSSDGVVTAVGEGTVTITVAVSETDNYESASASLELVVGSVQLSECTVTLSQTEYTYDGEAHTPAVTVQYGNVTLIENSDFEVDYSGNVNAGMATVTVTGLKNCSGTAEKSFTIHKADQELSASVDNEYIYVGSTGVIEAESDGDGTISYISDHSDVVEVDDRGNFTGVSAGTAVLTVVAEASDNYEESSEQTFTITVSRKNQMVTVTADTTSIKAGETIMVAGTTTGDGAISYTSSDTAIATVSSSGKVKGVGAGTVTITATAEATTDYNVASAYVKIKVGLTTPTISSVTNTTSGVKIKWDKVTGADGYYIYRKVSTADKYTRIATVEDGSTLAYINSCSSGSYKVSSGKTYYYKVVAFSGSTSSSKSSAKHIRYLTAGKISSLTNTGSGITVKWSKVSGATGYYVYRKTASGSYKKIKTISKSSTVSYTDTAVKNKNGTTYLYCVRPYYESSSGIITKGSYIGKKTVRLAATTLSSVKKTGSNKITVKWSKKSSVTGYQIQYSKSSSFSSGNKTVTVTGSSKKSKVISGLTRGKKYYVRIRTYKTVNGKKYYSAWSTKKSVKIT